MTDETIAFDVADNDLRAAASSCDANDADFIIPSIPSLMCGNMSSDRQCTGSGTEHGMSGGREKRRRGRRQRRRRFRARGMSAGAPGEGLRWGVAQTTISRGWGSQLPRRGRGSQPLHRRWGGRPGRQGRKRANVGRVVLLVLLVVVARRRRTSSSDVVITYDSSLVN
jgi:hypothetical protein